MYGNTQKKTDTNTDKNSLMLFLEPELYISSTLRRIWYFYALIRGSTYMSKYLLVCTSVHYSGHQLRFLCTTCGHHAVKTTSNQSFMGAKFPFS